MSWSPAAWNLILAPAIGERRSRDAEVKVDSIAASDLLSSFHNVIAIGPACVLAGSQFSSSITF